MDSSRLVVTPISSIIHRVETRGDMHDERKGREAPDEQEKGQHDQSPAADAFIEISEDFLAAHIDGQVTATSMGGLALDGEMVHSLDIKA